MPPIRVAVIFAAVCAGVVAAPASARSSLARCHTAGLAGHLGRIDAGAGSRFAPLVLVNTSSRSCTLRGYVGGRLAGIKTRVVRVSGVPVTTVTLRPGGAAVSDLRWSAIPSNTSGCPTPSRFDVTPPDETTQLTVTWRGGPVCGGEIDVRALRAQQLRR